MIIALSGKLQSGKDTFARYLLERLPGYEPKQFAEKLKLIVSIMTGAPLRDMGTAEGKQRYLPAWKMTVGEMLQRVGTDARWNPEGGWISADEWCEWAAPVWYRAMPKEQKEHQPFQGNYPSRHQVTDGICETDVLATSPAKDQEDEKHLCPLQLGVIERAVKLWSAPGDTVFSPFAGIGSEGYVSLKFMRKFVGIELKPSYFNVACDNLNKAMSERHEAGARLL